MPHVVAVEGLILIALLVIASMVEGASNRVKTYVKAAVGVMIVALFLESLLAVLA